MIVASREEAKEITKYLVTFIDAPLGSLSEVEVLDLVDKLNAVEKFVENEPFKIDNGVVYGNKI